jgi:hypothetical protein
VAPPRALACALASAVRAKDPGASESAREEALAADARAIELVPDEALAAMPDARASKSTGAVPALLALANAVAAPMKLPPDRARAVALEEGAALTARAAAVRPLAAARADPPAAAVPESEAVADDARFAAA